MKILIPVIAVVFAIPAFAQPSETKQPETDKSSSEKAKEQAKRAGAEAKRATKSAALTGKVKSALAADVGLKTVTINVDTEDTRRRAEVTARKVSGVTRVRNELHAKN